ncbi:restriction endonuclease subunit S [Microbacterium sp. NPDC077486]|uniref:restriction endonuclease subunit S n=1 Tax=Microbacterium sp. NPDC077486 TaxID=3154766 RepID=UPI00344A9D2F
MSDETSRAMLEWAPDIPPAWDVVNLKMLAKIFAGGTPDRKNADYWSDGTVPWLNSGSVNDWAISKPSELIAREALANGATRWAPKGSVLVALAGQGKTKGMAARLEINSTLNQSLAAIVPGISLDYRFLQYWLASNYLNIRGLAGGDLRDGLNLQHIGSIQVPRPPVEEQRAIADYLDHETAQIDAFIAKNEELIALLTERRSAVTAQAVTRGIDGSGALKDSGCEWLGRIPEDWEAVRVKFVARSLPGYAFASGDFVDDHAATRLLRGINVGVGTVSWAETVGVTDPPADVENRYRLDEGDLVLGMDRPVISGGLRLAPIAHGDAGALLVQRVLRLRGTRVRNDYLEYSLAWGGFAMYIEPDFTGVSVPHMSEQQVGKFTIALPDTPTQRRIVTHIREQHASIDAALETARQSIELMRERRAALISAAVTGKIDVGPPT